MENDVVFNIKLESNNFQTNYKTVCNNCTQKDEMKLSADCLQKAFRLS